MNPPPLIIKKFPDAEYEPIWRMMSDFTDARSPTAPDELWIVEHRPVFTLGQQGKREHLLNPGDIPIIQTDRGGQVTYHGPGQIVLYPLINLRRKKMGIRALVTALEQTMIALLADYAITAHARADAPGVYVEEAKIGSLGLRVRRGQSYHGLALNVNMDLEPFDRINPCGMEGMKMTQLSDQIQDSDLDINTVTTKLITHLSSQLGYNASSLKYLT